MKSIKLYIFICTAALVITGCSGDNSIKPGTYGVDISIAIPATKWVVAHPNIARVQIVAYNSGSTQVGSGELTESGTSWTGKITVSETGPIDFSVKAYNTDRNLLYVDGGDNIVNVIDGSNSLTVALQSAMAGRWYVRLDDAAEPDEIQWILNQTDTTVNTVFGPEMISEVMNINGDTFDFSREFYGDGINITFSGTGTISGDLVIGTYKMYESANSSNVFFDSSITMRRASSSATVADVFAVPEGAITVDGNIADWEAIPAMITDPADDCADIFGGEDLLEVKTAVDASGTTMYVLAKTDGPVSRKTSYQIAFKDYEKNVSFTWAQPGTRFGLSVNYADIAEGLLANTTYYFGISVDGTASQQIPVVIPGTQQTYKQLAVIINNALVAANPGTNGASARLTNDDGTTDIAVYSELFTTAASISVSAGSTNDIFSALGLTVPTGTSTTSGWYVNGYDDNNSCSIYHLNGTGADSGDYVEFSFDLSSVGLPYPQDQCTTTFYTRPYTWHSGYDKSGMFGYVSLPKSWNPLFSDNFDRETGLGANWTVGSGSAGIVSGELVIASGAAGQVGYNTLVDQADDPYTKITYKITGSAAASYTNGAGAAARFNTGTGTGYYVTITDSYAVIGRNMPAPQTLTYTAFTPTAGTTYICEFIINGSALTFDIKDSNMNLIKSISVNDSTYSAGVVGLFRKSTTPDTLSFNDFKVESYK